jgi:hypothetical protein
LPITAQAESLFHSGKGAKPCASAPRLCLPYKIAKRNRPALTVQRRAVLARAISLKEFQEFVKRDCTELAYCEGIAVSTRHFAFSKLPVFSTKVAVAIQDREA